MLIKTQEVEGEEHRQERRLGSPEVLGAEVIGTQIVFELLNALLDGGPPVVVAPERERVLVAVGDPHAEGV